MFKSKLHSFGRQIGLSICSVLFSVCIVPVAIAGAVVIGAIGRAMFDDLANGEQGLLKDPRSAVITTYALCGFAHLASMAIFVGGISALARDRTADIAKVAFRALVAATIACLLTACVAGALVTEGSILLGSKM